MIAMKNSIPLSLIHISGVITLIDGNFVVGDCSTIDMIDVFYRTFVSSSAFIPCIIQKKAVTAD